MNILEQPINDLIEEFLDNHDVAPVTKEKYRSNLGLFVRWMVQNNHQDIKSPRKAHVLAYKMYLISKKHSNRTIDSYIAPIKVFFKYLDTEVSKYDNITHGVKAMGNYTGHIKQHLKEEQVVKLLESIDLDTLRGKRDMAMINLMVSTGLRCVEVERLNIADMSRCNDIWVIKVQSKGHTDKDREMGLPQDVVDMIMEYLNYRGVTDDNEPMFVTGEGDRMRSYLISRHIKSRLLDIGINSKKITAHSLRHTAAVMALNNGASIHDVQIMLGHRDIKTSMIYLSSIEHEKALSSGAVHMNAETLRKAREMYKKGLKTGTNPDR